MTANVQFFSDRRLIEETLVSLPKEFIMTSTEFYRILKKQFPFETTLKQDIFLQKIAQFVTSEVQDELFVLKG